MTKDEALRLALEALKEASDKTEPESNDWCMCKICLAIDAIKSALEAKDEPVGSFMTRLQAIDFLLKMRPQTEPTEKQIIATIDAYSALFGDMIESPAPPQRKPLTDEEIVLIVAECAASHQHTDIHFARAIEAAHGIKGEA